MGSIKIGIIGGSGLYHIENLQGITEHDINTPFGRPSDKILTGSLDGVEVAFLARHGREHALIPSEVPYRANIFALKQLGVKYLLSLSAVGSLQESVAPLDMLIPDQYIDLTRARTNTFFGEGAVAHVSMAQPVCNTLSDVLAEAVNSAAPNVKLHHSGTYICIEGPQFSTLAESNYYRSMGGDIIGMTNMPEARLAREAQMAYASLAMITDFDCWHPGEENVTTNMAIANLMKNAETAQRITLAAIQLLHNSNPASIAHTALENALVTNIESMSEEKREMVSQLLS